MPTLYAKLLINSSTDEYSSQNSVNYTNIAITFCNISNLKKLSEVLIKMKNNPNRKSFTLKLMELQFYS